MGGQARGYTWERFTPGNDAATTHGLHRAARADEIAERVEAEAAQVAQRYPWTANYADERNRYARAVIDRIDGRAYVEQRIAEGVNDEDRERLSRLVKRLEDTEAARARALGISPMSHADLMLRISGVVRFHGSRPGVLADSLDELLRAGQRALEARTDDSGGDAA